LTVVLCPKRFRPTSVQEGEFRSRGSCVRGGAVMSGHRHL